ncbi:unnamed protein product, partial [Cylindrotheca closterium]
QLAEQGYMRYNIPGRLSTLGFDVARQQGVITKSQAVRFDRIHGMEDPVEILEGTLHIDIHAKHVRDVDDGLSVIGYLDDWNESQAQLQTALQTIEIITDEKNSLNRDLQSVRDELEAMKAAHETAATMTELSKTVRPVPMLTVDVPTGPPGQTRVSTTTLLSPLGHGSATPATAHETDGEDGEDQPNASSPMDTGRDGFGDNHLVRAQGSARLAFQNINTTPDESDDLKQAQLNHWIRSECVDFLLLAELNKFWPVITPTNQWRQRASTMARKGEGFHSAVAYNTHQPRAAHSTTQFGGCSTSAFNEVSHQVRSSGDDSLGRWAWIRLQGQTRGVGQRDLVVLSAYRPNPPNDGHQTVWFQHKAHFSRTNRDAEPREAFIKDLSTAINKWRDDGCSIILGIDANDDLSSYSPKSFRFRMSEVGLVEAIQSKHPGSHQATYQRNQPTKSTHVPRRLVMHNKRVVQRYVQLAEQGYMRYNIPGRLSTLGFDVARQQGVITKSQAVRFDRIHGMEDPVEILEGTLHIDIHAKHVRDVDDGLSVIGYLDDWNESQAQLQTALQTIEIITDEKNSLNRDLQSVRDELEAMKAAHETAATMTELSKTVRPVPMLTVDVPTGPPGQTRVSTTTLLSPLGHGSATPATAHETDGEDGEDQPNASSPMDTGRDGFGDNHLVRAQGSARLAFQNINTTPDESDDLKQAQLNHWIRSECVDFLLLAELNKFWPVITPTNQWRQRASTMARKGEGFHSAVAYNTHQPRAAHSTTQFGGCSTSAFNEVSHQVRSSGDDSLGRWAWIRLQGQTRGVGQRDLVVLSAYRPNPPNDGHQTVWFQHKAHFSRTNRDAEPREAFIKDLSTAINKWRDDGCSIILGIDANDDLSSYSPKSFRFRMSEVGLVEAIQSKHPGSHQATYQRNQPTKSTHVPRRLVMHNKRVVQRYVQLAEQGYMRYNIPGRLSTLGFDVARQQGVITKSQAVRFDRIHGMEDPVEILEGTLHIDIHAKHVRDVDDGLSVIGYLDDWNESQAQLQTALQTIEIITDEKNSLNRDLQSVRDELEAMKAAHETAATMTELSKTVRPVPMLTVDVPTGPPGQTRVSTTTLLSPLGHGSATPATAHETDGEDGEDQPNASSPMDTGRDGFGDNHLVRAQGSARLAFQNINTTPDESDDLKQAQLNHWIRSECVDFLLLAELNKFWPVITPTNQWRQRASTMARKGEGFHSAVAYNTHQPRAAHSTTQFGGCSTSAFNEVSHQVRSSGDDSLGRWAWIRLQGQTRGVGQRDLVVLSAYRPNPPNDGHQTVWFQHKAHFSRTNRDAEPREAFIKDLSTAINKWRDDGCSIILGIDANDDLSSYSPKSFRFRMSEVGLVEAIQSKHPYIYN